MWSYKISPILIIIQTVLINVILNTSYNFIFISGNKNYMFTSSLSSNGDLIVTSSPYSISRLRSFYGIKANGQPYFFINGKYSYYLNLELKEDSFVCESNGGFIVINNINYFLTSSYNTGTEFYNLNNYEYKLFNTETFLGVKMTSARNSIFELKKYPGKYLFCFYSREVEKMKLLEIGFTNENLELNNGYEIILSNEINTKISRIFSCFETDNNYILCLCINNDDYFVINIVNIENLNVISTFKTNYRGIEQTFNKAIHLKKNIGVFIIFENGTTSYPILLIKELKDENTLANYIENFDEKKIQDTISNWWNINDVIKINDYKFALISGEKNYNKEIYILLFILYNNDKNIFMKKYTIQLENNLKFYDAVRGLSYNGIIGIGIALRNSNSEDPEYQALLLLGYLNSTDIEENQKTLFTNNEFKLKNYLEKESIDNNIFGYSLYKIKITDVYDQTNESNFQFQSKNLNKQIKINDILDLEDSIIISKIKDNIPISKGIYYISFVGIIKEPDYSSSIKLADRIETIFGTDSYENYYEQNEYYSKVINFTINIEKPICPNYISYDYSICYDEIPEGQYYYENEDKRLSICNENCKTCFGNFNENNQNCSSCKEGYTLNSSLDISNCIIKQNIIINNKCEKNLYEFNDECYKSCPEGTKIDSSITEYNSCICNKLYYVTKKKEKKHYNCLTSKFCDKDHQYLSINNENECTDCRVIYNNKCYASCPANTCVKEESISKNKNCVNVDSNTKIVSDICFENYEKQISNAIDELKNNTQKQITIIKNNSVSETSFYTYKSSSDIDHLSENYNLTFVNLGKVAEKIKKEYNLNNNEELYISVIETKNKFSNSSISDYEFEIYLNNYTKVNLSFLEKNDEIQVSNPIKNLEIAHYDYALQFNGTDIYNISSDFYNDKCVPASINGTDIVLSDRILDIYPVNVTICSTGCKYAGRNLNTKRFICDCTINNEDDENKNNEQINNKEEDDGDFLTYILDQMNFYIIKCVSLVTVKEDYKNNFGFYVSFGLTVINIFMIIFFFIFSVRNITRFLYNNIPSENEIKNQANGLNSNPTKKNKLKPIVLNDKRKSVNELRLSNQTFMLSKNMENNQNNNNIINNNETNNKRNKRRKKRILTVKIEVSSLRDIKNGKGRKSVDDKNHFRNQLSFDYLSPIHDKNIDESEFNQLPYSSAIIYDHRNIFSIFSNIFITKIEIIQIIFYSEKYTSILLELNKYILGILLELFFNAFLFNDDVISQKYHANGELDKFTSLFMSTVSKILSSIFEYLINRLSDVYSIVPILLKEVKSEKYYLYNVFKILKIMHIKISCFLIVEVIVSSFITYYLFVFCTIYSNAQNNFIANYFYGVIESLLISLAIALVVTTLRMIGLKNRNKDIYNTSKFINERF